MPNREPLDSNSHAPIQKANSSLTRDSLEEVVLPSGKSVLVPKWNLSFRKWRGVPIQDTYNNKAIVDLDGQPLFAELAILRLLQRKGWNGVWVDSYRSKYRTDLPERNVGTALPSEQEKLIQSIRAKTKKRGGCWDIFGWKENAHLFAESKRSKRDIMRPNQLLWLQEGLNLGLKPKNLLVVEWDLELGEERPVPCSLTGGNDGFTEVPRQ